MKVIVCAGEKLSEKKSYRAVGWSDGSLVNEDVSGHGIFSRNDVENFIRNKYPNITNLKIFIIYNDSEIAMGNPESKAYAEELEFKKTFEMKRMKKI